ncbi:hypothetical protein HZS61_007301 [Fusarium oxysporum f. sp. conglutinans]|uniref:Uncharacterized protein n=1 Tax=Fusarium oxysporum f. sp. conglutinans TaxID=100902 RepID=A0A8H6G7W4_FUSOX|nr:hypothetical protein HZS61_007301 [Fusarium oxysporum f. sp. conglutinans]
MLALPEREQLLRPHVAVYTAPQIFHFPPSRSLPLHSLLSHNATEFLPSPTPLLFPGCSISIHLPSSHFPYATRAPADEPPYKTSFPPTSLFESSSANSLLDFTPSKVKLTFETSPHETMRNS